MLSKCCFHFIQQRLDKDAPDGTRISSRFAHFDENYGRSIIQSGREVYLAVGLNQSAAIPGGVPRLQKSELQHCRQTD